MITHIEVMYGIAGLLFCFRGFIEFCMARKLPSQPTEKPLSAIGTARLLVTDSGLIDVIDFPLDSSFPSVWL